MSLTGLAIIYIIIWWIIFFAILPIDVERNKVIKIEQGKKYLITGGAGFLGGE